MAHAEEAIRKGGEAFLATIEMVGETETPDLGNIPVAAEYADVFEPLRGPRVDHRDHKMANTK